MNRRYNQDQQIGVRECLRGSDNTCRKRALLPLAQQQLRLRLALQWHRERIEGAEQGASARGSGDYGSRRLHAARHRRGVDPYLPRSASGSALRRGTPTSSTAITGRSTQRSTSRRSFLLKELERGARHRWLLNPSYKGICRLYFTKIQAAVLPKSLPAYRRGHDVRV